MAFILDTFLSYANNNFTIDTAQSCDKTFECLILIDFGAHSHKYLQTYPTIVLSVFLFHSGSCPE